MSQTPNALQAGGPKKDGVNDSNKVADDGEDFIFKQRTFDVVWVERSSLMYTEGIDKTFDKITRKAHITRKKRSSIPLILRDMGPPKGSIFDPKVKWDEEKERRRTEEEAAEVEVKLAKKESAKGKKKKESKKTSADLIKENNQANKDDKNHSRDLQKLGNLRSLKALQEAFCETDSGKIHRMMKMLHIAVCDLKNGSVNSSEAEVLDILWALEEMPNFKSADKEIQAEKSAKKDKEKEEKKKSKKDSKKEKDGKGKKDSKKEEKKEKIVLSLEAKQLKELYKESDSRGSYKDSIKHARKIMSSKKDLISFQMLEMYDRLPPLSLYNRKFRLEKWQCDILDAIDNRTSAVVCAPTSSGKTLLSTYTCQMGGPVLFVLPSEVLVWQVAATYYEFFKGNVTICTEQIQFQEITGGAQVYIGTPTTLEKALTKARGVAGQEMVKGEREFMVLDGGYNFKYLVLDEVHTLNGPEGDALQRIISATNCPILALSATIGNANQLKNWFKTTVNRHLSVIENEETQVVLKEHFARFINLQRYVVVEEKGYDGKKKEKLVKLHPVAAMTPERLLNEPDLVASLSMTPIDMMDLWKRMVAIFPSTAFDKLDDPDKFFAAQVNESKRITLDQTKDYETRLKTRLAALSQSHPELYEKLRLAKLPPPIEAKHDVSEKLYPVLQELKKSDMLPAVGFQLDTYGAFNMFKTLLRQLEAEQNAEFPDYRKDLIKSAREKAQMRKVAAGKASSKNELEEEEDAKSGFTDDSLVAEDTTRPHDKYVLAPAGKRLGLTEVEDIIADMKKSGEKVDIGHALIRGLRRGIAIYTKEVGFSCYRRQVQILAQKGRLGVVFSDDALAYGVNMPFRSCIFCGDMGTSLTPLIAQQMQGRAGRRGMDVQGNVIYLGMDWPYIENLMLGQISHVTGKEPRYPTMALQRAIAASNDPNDDKHFIHFESDVKGFAPALMKQQRDQHCHPTVSEEMMEWIAGPSLSDFCEEKSNSSYYETSKTICQSLGYVYSDLRLVIDHNVATMIWELESIPKAIHLAAVLDQLYYRFCYNKTKSFKESDSTQNEFLSVLIHVADRVPAKEGEQSLQEFLRLMDPSDGNKILNEDGIEMWKQTESLLLKEHEKILSIDVDVDEKKKMILELPPTGELGVLLDKAVYEMLTTKQKGFREDQLLDERNSIKDRIVGLGQLCLVVHNNLQQPHGKYSELEIHFRRMFANIKYCVADMMNQLTDQEDITES